MGLRVNIDNKIIEVMLDDKNALLGTRDATDGKNKLAPEYIATMCANMNALGFYPSAKLYNYLANIEANEAVSEYYTIIQRCNKKVGNALYVPFYPGFPEQVLSLADEELYINAIVHYLSDGEYFPAYQEYCKEGGNRAKPVNSKDLIEIDLCTEDDFIAYAKSIIGAKSSISDSNKEVIELAIRYFDLGEIESIPHKEVLATVLATMIVYKPSHEVMHYRYLMHTITDVLRVITAMSGGDVTLKENCRFCSLKRWQRRWLMGIINEMGNYEEANKYANKWKRVAERIHPFEFKNYENACGLFSTILSGKMVVSYNSQVEQLFKEGNWDSLISLLSTRPGVFARNLDRLYRSKAPYSKVLGAFEEVANKVSVPVLLQVKTFFENREYYSSVDTRSYFPKGSVAKAFTVKKDTHMISKTAATKTATVCKNALLDIFSSRDDMGKVYIDKSMKSFNVPFSQRSSGKALKSIVRGSRLDIQKNAKVVRAFMWWKNGESRTDLDLSAVMLDNNFEYVGHISYTDLRSTHGYVAVHSGDIVDAPNGACEFIDIDLDSFKELGGRDVRYVVFQVYSFTGQSFSSLSEALAGWMVLDEVGKHGDIYDPKNVRHKFDLTADSKVCVPMMLDLETNQIIWMDMQVKGSNAFNNVEKKLGSVTHTVKAICNTKKANMHELMKLHAQSHGTLVTSKKDADIIVSLDGDIKPYDVNTIMSEYL